MARITCPYTECPLENGKGNCYCYDWEVKNAEDMLQTLWSFVGRHDKLLQQNFLEAYPYMTAYLKVEGEK